MNGQTNWIDRKSQMKFLTIANTIQQIDHGRAENKNKNGEQELAKFIAERRFNRHGKKRIEEH
jgi:hypothetical protein